MTDQVIPDEAIEAAAEALVGSTLGDRRGINWEEFFEAARGALNAAAPYMLARVATARELEALPRLSVIRTDEGTVYERHTMWHEAGSRDLKYSPDIILPATVLQLGWGEE